MLNGVMEHLADCYRKKEEFVKGHMDEDEEHAEEDIITGRK